MRAPGARPAPAYPSRTWAAGPTPTPRSSRRPTRRGWSRVDERRLGPVVGLGAWNTFDTDTRLAREVVDAALEAGTRVFDTSPMYRGAERSLGEALDGRGVVATKIWADSAAE